MESVPAARGSVRLTVAACAALFLLGVGEGVIGSFQYSGGLGPVPAAALGFAALILVTCLLGAWGMRSPAGGVLPAVGWFAATFALATGTRGGSVVITGTTQGEWFLFGGAVCAAAGLVAAIVAWSPGRIRRRRAGS